MISVFLENVAERLNDIVHHTTLQRLFVSFLLEVGSPVAFLVANICLFTVPSFLLKVLGLRISASLIFIIRFLSILFVSSTASVLPSADCTLMFLRSFICNDTFGVIFLSFSPPISNEVHGGILERLSVISLVPRFSSFDRRTA